VLLSVFRLSLWLSGTQIVMMKYDFFACGDFFSQGSQGSKVRKGISLREIGLRLLH
jgi:hypothetical protein